MSNVANIAVAVAQSVARGATVAAIRTAIRRAWSLTDRDATRLSGTDRDSLYRVTDKRVTFADVRRLSDSDREALMDAIATRGRGGADKAETGKAIAVPREAHGVLRNVRDALTPVLPHGTTVTLTMAGDKMLTTVSHGRLHTHLTVSDIGNLVTPARDLKAARKAAEGDGYYDRLTRMIGAGKNLSATQQAYYDAKSAEYRALSDGADADADAPDTDSEPVVTVVPPRTPARVSVEATEAGIARGRTVAATRVRIGARN